MKTIYSYWDVLLGVREADFEKAPYIFILLISTVCDVFSAFSLWKGVHQQALIVYD